MDIYSIYITILGFLKGLIGFILILMPLVIFHELGHFLFAKLFGVKAEVFSVGFGPVIWSKKIGETDFRLSWIPLGGYVKLLGEEPGQKLPENELMRSLSAQAPWKRFWIFFGGPLFNFILAIFIFILIFLIGEPHVSNFVARVTENSSAYQAGLRSADKILEVNSVKVTTWDDVVKNIAHHIEKPVQLLVEHENTRQELLTITPIAVPAFNNYGEPIQIGVIDGVFEFYRAPIIGVSNPQSLAAQLQIVTGDKIIAMIMDGQKRVTINSWEQFESLYKEIQKEFTLEIEQKDKTQKTVQILKPANTTAPSEIGLHSCELFIQSVVEGSVAQAAGLLPNDRIVTLNQKPIDSFFDLKKAIQTEAEQNHKVNLSIERQGQMLVFALHPEKSESKDFLLNKVVNYTIGIVPRLVLVEPLMVQQPIYNPIVLVSQATQRVCNLSWKNLVSLKKMLFRETSINSIGGPFMIAKIAGESLSRGLMSILSSMALFSIGLGVLNILPIPLLDGGHIALLGVEGLRKKPLTLKQMEVLQTIGLFIVGLLMFIAFRNDIYRIFWS